MICYLKYLNLIKQKLPFLNQFISIAILGSELRFVNLFNRELSLRQLVRPFINSPERSFAHKIVIFNFIIIFNPAHKFDMLFIFLIRHNRFSESLEIRPHHQILPPIKFLLLLLIRFGQIFWLVTDRRIISAKCAPVPEVSLLDSCTRCENIKQKHGGKIDKLVGEHYIHKCAFIRHVVVFEILPFI